MSRSALAGAVRDRNTWRCKSAIDPASGTVPLPLRFYLLGFLPVESRMDNDELMVKDLELLCCN